jgi:hypothetical protein
MQPNNSSFFAFHTMATETLPWADALRAINVPPQAHERVQRVMQECGIKTTQTLCDALATCASAEGLNRPYSFQGTDFGSDQGVRRAVQELLDVAATVRAMDYSHSVEPYEHPERLVISSAQQKNGTPVTIERSSQFEAADTLREMLERFLPREVTVSLEGMRDKHGLLVIIPDDVAMSVDDMRREIDGLIATHRLNTSVPIDIRKTTFD